MKRLWIQFPVQERKRKKEEKEKKSPKEKKKVEFLTGLGTIIIEALGFLGVCTIGASKT